MNINYKIIITIKTLLSALALLTFLQAPAYAGISNSEFWITDGALYSMADDADALIIGGDFAFVGPNIKYGSAISTSTGGALGSFPALNGIVYAVVPDGAGGWIIGGDFTLINGVARSRLARIKADKSVDTSFPEANGIVRSLALSTDGNDLYVGGEFSGSASIGGVARDYIAALTLSANVWSVSGWDPNASGIVRTMVLSPDSGTIYVGGDFNGVNSIGGADRNCLAALATGTGTAMAWDPDIDSPGASVRTLALSEDGTRLYIGGSFTSINTVPRNNLVVLDTLASIKSDILIDSWNPAGANNTVNSLDLFADTLYVGGEFSGVGAIAGADRDYLATVAASDGSIKSWNPVVDGGINTMQLSDDKSTLYVGGNFQTIAGLERNSVAAINTSNASILSWDPKAVVIGSPGVPTVSGSVYALSIQAGVIYIGGDYSSIGGGRYRSNLARIELGTDRIADWKPDPNGAVHAIIKPDDAAIVYVGGEFTQIEGEARKRLALLNVLGGVRSFIVPVTGTVKTLVLSKDRLVLYIGGDFNGAASVKNVDRNYIASISVGNTSVRPWNPGANGSVEALELTEDETIMFVGGGFSGVNSIGGADRDFLAAVKTTENNNNATDWNPKSNGTVRTLELKNRDQELLVGGDFTFIGGVSREHIAELTYSIKCNTRRELITPRESAECENIATSWNVGTNGSVRSLILSTDDESMYAGGDFTLAGGVPHQNFAEFLLDPLLADVTGWSPAFNSPVEALWHSKDNNTLFVGGQFSQLDANQRRSLARFDRPVVTASPAGGAYGTAQNITLNCSDSLGAGCDEIYYTTDGTTPKSDLSGTTQAYSLSPIPPVLPGFTLSLKYFATALSGVRSITTTEEFIVEDQPPVSSATPGSGTLNISNYSPIELACDDGAGSGCDKIFYTLDGTVPGTVADCDNGAPGRNPIGTCEYIDPIRLIRNTALTFFAVDRAGNIESPPKTEDYIVDLRAPVTTMSPQSTTFREASMTISLSCNDNDGAGCARSYYILNRSAPILYTGPFVINRDVVIEFYSEDNAGNRETKKRESFVSVYTEYGGAMGASVFMLAAFALFSCFVRGWRIRRYNNVIQSVASDWY